MQIYSNITDTEFLNKIWPPKIWGDSLRIIRKSDKKEGGRENAVLLWECEFINYPNVVFVRKDRVIRGLIRNSEIENQTFIGKVFHQNCGYDLKVIEKTKELNSYQQYYYIIEFLNNNYKRKALKQSILEGSVDNLGLPWKSKGCLENYIKKNYNHKPTLKELQDDLKENFIGAPISLSQYICKYKLRDLISYWEEVQQKEVLKYIKQILKI